MKVEDLILQLQDVISAAKSMPFSGGKVMVSSDEIYDILDQIQDAMPAEVRQAKNIVDNADALCKGLMNRGFDIVSGGTDNHLMLVNLINKGVTGKEVEKLLDAANITCNKNTIPNDPASPFVTSGIRLGTAAVTTRGFNTEDMDVVAEAIALLVDDVEKNQAKAMELVKGLTDKYPLYE